MLSQLTNKHKGISNVVNKIKNKDNPSTPNEIDKLKIDNHSNELENWKEDVDLLKKTHKIREKMKVKQEKLKAIIFKYNLL